MSFLGYVPYFIGGGMIIIGMTLIVCQWYKNKAKKEAEPQDLKIGESDGGHNATYACPESVKEESKTEENPTEAMEENSL